MFKAPYDDLRLWWTKSLLIWNLSRADVTSRDPLRKALRSFAVALSLSVLTQFALLQVLSPQSEIAELIGLPILALVPIMNTAGFVLVVVACVRLACGPAPFATIASGTVYALSGAIPLVAVLAIEQLNRAVALFLERGDPSDPYLSTAIFVLLTSDPGSLAWRIRMWLFFTIQVVVIVTYLLYYLPKLLSKAMPQASFVRFRVTLAVLGACALHTIVLQAYLGRAFWMILSTLLDARNSS